MDMLGKVRRMKLRDKLSISEIARRTGLSRNTVRGWLRAPGDVVPKYERRLDPRKISDYEPTLIAALKADRLRNKDARRTARALFVQIYDVVETGTGKRDNSLLWVITTAGSNRSGICYEVRTFVTRLLNGVFNDDIQFGIIYGLDDGDDWTSLIN